LPISSKFNRFSIKHNREVVRFYLKIELTEEEEKLLNQTMTAFYGATDITK
jgi:hypothetical protein